MSEARNQIQQIYCAAVSAVDPRRCVQESLAELPIGIEDDDTVSIIAIGKAAGQMALGALDAMGSAIQNGIVVTKEVVDAGDGRFTYFEGAHPVPDDRSLRAGTAILDFAAAIPDGTVALCLISGGGSALVEALRPGVSLVDLQRVTTDLLRAGAPIEAMNSVRSRLSRIKGGGLLTTLAGTRVVNLVVSDVLGDQMQAIASGPTVPPAGNLTAEDVLSRYSISFDLPPPAESTAGEPIETRIVANLGKAIDAAAIKAGQMGLRPLVFAADLQGEARDVGSTIASILGSCDHPHSPFQSNDCILLGGETTVTVRGDGQGGRNTESALAAALVLQGSPRVAAGFLATDGDDGTTAAAGAIIDGATISADGTAAARQALDDNDSYPFLQQAGAVWAPGATGTNVNDLVIGIIK